MGLDFTEIEDKSGAAVYLIHDGASQNEQKMARLAEDIKGHTSHQVVILSARDPAAIKVMDFYDLKGTNLVLIVQDDDQLFQVWQENEIPMADQIAFSVSQIG